MKLFKHSVLALGVISSAAFAGEVTPVKPGALPVIKLACPAGARQMGDGEGFFCTKSGSPGAERLNGPYVGVHKNGQKEAEGNYVNGKREGQWTYFDVNGVKSGETQYRNDNFDGLRIQYFPNGQKKLEEIWVAGKRQGVAKSWDGTGKLSTVEYRDDWPMTASK